ncbi:hypothetical protein L7F22_018894 [Adiantum nelumboides]|nr:hypothetical protein [Adiantum nelumboides]
MRFFARMDTWAFGILNIASCVMQSLQANEPVSCLNDIMETKGGKRSSILQYEAPLGYVIEEVRPNGGIEKFHSAAYYNCARKPS